MVNLKLSTAVLLIAIAGLPQEVVSKSMVSGGVDNATTVVTDHNAFFASLQYQEQLAIMKLAIQYYDADDLKIKPFPFPSSLAKPSLNSGVPFPGDDPAQPISETLVSHFLNGKVPTDFQKQFTNWLKKEYKLTTKNLDLYRTSGSFCNVAAGEDCPILDDIGGLCCPFG